MVNPSSRDLHHQRQRDATRSAILSASRAIFAERGYLATTIEQILGRAVVSRAGFYAHFSSKLAVVLAIADGFMPIWAPLYDRLGAIRPDDFPALTDWAADLIAIYRENHAICTLLTQVAAIEEPLSALFGDQRESIIRRLAAVSPAFRAAIDDAAMRMRATLLLAHLDQACFILTHRRHDLDPASAPRVLAEHIQAFLTAI
jgi:AcrR family transcriptional regulator